MAEEKKEWSKVFTAFKEFKDAVHGDPANQPGGTHTVKKDDKEFEVPNLSYSVYGFKDRKDKEDEKKRDGAEFVMGKNGGEAIRFILANSGALRGAEYVNWTGVAKGGQPQEKVWVGKDFEKLSSVVKDPLLVQLASKLDWTKAADKEQAPEAEQENDEIGDR